MDEEVEVLRGNQALQLLENPLLVEALEAIEKKYEDGWRNSQPSGVDKREKAYLMLHILSEFKQYLTRLVQTGKMAATARDARAEQSEVQQRINDWDGSTDGIV